MPAEYNKYSPYFQTETYGTFLDVLSYRPIPKNASDVTFTINAIYQYRPDLLANDLYGRSSLWWVFAARNRNVIQDPIWDFKTGRTIYIPNGKNLFAALGI
jgi:hypothetical protein